MDTLKSDLIKKKKRRWLDIGANKNFEQGFLYMDISPKKIIPKEFRDSYIQLSILTAGEKEFSRIGKFDLVRMQHVIEHFDFEDAVKVLKNASLLLSRGGLILLTVPDLKKNIKEYLNGHYKKWPEFVKWAQKRIPKNAPLSFYFSIFTHSLPATRHFWCYDAKGLKYVINLTGKYRNIKKLDIQNFQSSIPFTHNRPQEDLCILAVKK